MVNIIYSHTVHGVALVGTMMKLLLGGSNRGESNGSVFGSITELQCCHDNKCSASE